MKGLKALCGLLLLLLVSGCNLTRESSKYEFSNGIYKTRNAAGKAENRFVLLDDDTIKTYPVRKVGSTIVVDTALPVVAMFPEEVNQAVTGARTFTKHTWDIDFLTILFKFRPAREEVPRQLNSNFNAAFYFGHRADIYRIRYEPLPLRLQKREIAHYGYSFGFFSGLGSTLMNNTVSRHQVQDDYDGVVWLNGVSAIVGVNSFTLGLGLGFDHLLDPNRRHWIYQGKPWLGLTLGLNLN